VVASVRVSKGVQLGVGVLRLLTEYVQGPCKENQLALAAFKEGYETSNRLLAAINDRLRHQMSDPYCSACATPIRKSHPSSPVTASEEGVGRTSTNDNTTITGVAATTSQTVTTTTATTPTQAIVAAPSPSLTHVGGTGVQATCENGHPVCDSQSCRGRADRIGWACPFCEVLILEKSILQYLSGLLEGNDLVQTYGNQINAIHVPVFFKYVLIIHIHSFFQRCLRCTTHFGGMICIVCYDFTVRRNQLNH
jgi:hypothetical protein